MINTKRRAYLEKRRDRINMLARAKRAVNPERYREYGRKYREANREAHNEYSKIRKREIRALKRSLAEPKYPELFTPKEKKHLSYLRYYERNKERVKEHARIYGDKTRVLRRNQISLKAHERHRALRLQLFLIVSDDGVHVRCIECHYDKDIRALHFDHIHHGGNIDAKRFGAGYNVKQLQYYIAHPEESKAKLQILCANCNLSKQRRRKIMIQS